MATNVVIGTRLKKLRRERGLSQVNLADRLGISASYLNLIEHNRRSLTVPLLLRLSQILNVDPQIFSIQQDSQLIAQLTEVLKDPLFEELGLSEDDVGEMATNAPAIAQAMAKAYNAYRNSQDDLQVLSERLAQDPVLSDSTYRLKTLLTSIMSFSEILHDNVDLEPAERQNFLKIVLDESESLTETVNDMLGFITGDGLMGAAENVSPSEAVTDFLQIKGNYFQELEDAAEELRRDAGLEGPAPRARLVSYLLERHGVSVEIAGREIHDTEFSIYDEGKRHLTLSKVLSASSINFHLALFIGHMSYESIFEKLTDSPELPSATAVEKAKAALANYFAGACLLPYEAFYEAAQSSRYDIELLQHRFSASFEQVCHRMTTLRRPDASGIPFHLIRVDIAGNISKRYSASGMRIPRYGSACPRWVMHNAFLTPGIIRTQVCQMPDSSRYFSLARTVIKPSFGFNHPKGHYVISIGCEISDANQLVYADGLDLDSETAAVPVGVACRLCDRQNCAQRAAPPPPQAVVGTATRGRNITPGIGGV
ncbi:MAG: short-chain fatty acyl-CoA regulator family protein [Rhodospirillales bacterium]|nr:short-chain fatty acyl-CoA regulator family protein [Rhodospirillales bacterium]